MAAMCWEAGGLDAGQDRRKGCGVRSGQHNMHVGERNTDLLSHSWCRSTLQGSGSHQMWHMYHHSDREVCTQLHMTDNT